MDGVLISIHPCYADLIMRGDKQVELRRRRVRVQQDTQVFLYATAPVKAIVGYFLVKEMVELPPSKLWTQVGRLSGLRRREFREYFAGVGTGFALVIGDICAYSEVKPLASIRRVVPDFKPPRSFYYLRAGRRPDRRLRRTLLR